MATIKEIIENEEFLKELVTVDTPEALVELLKANDIALEENLTPDEAFNIVKAAENAELNEDNLEEVSGGIALTLAISCVAVTVIATAELHFIAGYGWRKIKGKK